MRASGCFTVEWKSCFHWKDSLSYSLPSLKTYFHIFFHRSIRLGKFVFIRSLKVCAFLNMKEKMWNKGVKSFSLTQKWQALSINPWSFENPNSFRFKVVIWPGCDINEKKALKLSKWISDIFNASEQCKRGEK